MNRDREDEDRLPDDGPDIISSRFASSRSGRENPEEPDSGSGSRKPRYEEYSLDVISDSYSGASGKAENHLSGKRRRLTGAESRKRAAKSRANVKKRAEMKSRMEAQKKAEARNHTAPESRKGTPRKKKKGKRIRRVLLTALLVICALAGLTAYYGYSRFGLLQRLPWNQDALANNNLNIDIRNQMSGYWTVAVFGVDSRDNELGAGNNADVNIIVNVNHDTGEIRLASIYRDTYMKIGDDTYNKINAAYQIGGPEQAVQALNTNLDLEIDDYATFNWKAVAEAINILGGVDIDISEDEFKYINAFITETVKATDIGSTQLEHAGLNHLDGIQAVAYGRLRLMDSDFRRTQRQRLVIEKTLEKMKQADLSTLDNLVKTVFPQIATSADMSDLLAMASNIGHYNMSSTYGFPEDNGGTRVSGRGYCVIPRTLESNVIKLHEFLFDDSDYEVSEQVQEISSHIIDVSGLGKMKEGETSADDDEQETLVSEWRSSDETEESTEEETQKSSQAKKTTEEDEDSSSR